MHIGLIGGIGPAATEVYYRELVRAFATAGRPLSLTIVHADVRMMIANLTAKRRSEQAAIFSSHVDQLAAGGCDAVAVTSMGGHFCVEELMEISSLPVLSAVPALNHYFADSGLKRIGVLGTGAAMDSGLYGVDTVEVVAPVLDDRAQVHAAYVELAATGVVTPERQALFHDAARKLHEDQGADAVILGGTDLSVAFAGVTFPFPIIDSAMVHVNAIASAAMAS